MSRLTDEIKQAFDLATLRREAMKNLTGSDWSAYVRVTEAHQSQRRFAQRSYTLEHDERIAQARLRLINKAGTKTHDFKHRWFGQDRFAKEAINKQAEKQVYQAYQNDLARIDRDEAQAISELIDAVEARNQKQVKVKDNFERATDRRSGTDRRANKRSIS